MKVGTIAGGTTPNIVPRTCKVRSLPDADPNVAPERIKAFAEEKLLPRMRVVALTASIETLHQGSVPAFPRQARIRGRRAGACDHRRPRHECCVLCDGSRTVRGGLLPDRDLRARRHRAGPCGRRVRHDRAARRLHGGPRQARRAAQLRAANSALQTWRRRPDRSGSDCCRTRTSPTPRRRPPCPAGLRW